eukprot:TRINITY_DN5996_c0_g3_i2.p1 TRINITY_DN5996_c0_g3~~TRINITY_DN5996_c0_g3_i2.p1  ORF type:complete len:237 (+),score=33.65 TRINITY_DN5996_c0_g3_i2:138-848(+)
MIPLLILLGLVSCVTSIPVYTAEGTHYEVGKIIGRAAQKEIALTMANPTIQKIIPFLDTPTGKQIFEGFYINTVKNYPQYVDEIRGLADGSGFTLENIFMLFAKSEIESFMGLRDQPNRVEHCTDILANSYTPCWGHNEDGDVYDRDTTYITNVTIVSSEGEIIDRFVAFAYGGTIAADAYGFNYHGLVLSENAIDAKKLNYYVSFLSFFSFLISFYFSFFSSVLLSLSFLSVLTF